MIDFGIIVIVMVILFDINGNIDFVKIMKLVNYLIDNGIIVIVVGGMIGEFFILILEEKVVLYCYVVFVVDKRVFVIVGIGSNNMYVFIDLIKKVIEVGVDVVMLVVLYYNKLS